MCCRTTCGKSKFKFAARCAPGGSSVELLYIWWHLCSSGGEDQRQLLPSYHHQLGAPPFRKQCSFVDKIKLNYSLANTTLQYVHVAISAVASTVMGHWGTCPPGVCECTHILQPFKLWLCLSFLLCHHELRNPRAHLEQNSGNATAYIRLCTLYSLSKNVS